MAAHMPLTPAAEETGPPGEDVKPYRIHVRLIPFPIFSHF